jgi:hypothetical protein
LKKSNNDNDNNDNDNNYDTYYDFFAYTCTPKLRSLVPLVARPTYYGIAALAIRLMPTCLRRTQNGSEARGDRKSVV